MAEDENGKWVPMASHEWSAKGLSGFIYHFKLTESLIRMVYHREGDPCGLGYSFPVGLYSTPEDAFLPLHVFLRGYPTAGTGVQKTAKELVVLFFHRKKVKDGA